MKGSSVEINRLWLGNYAHAGCWAQVFNPMPVAQILERSALQHGDATALDFMGRSYSYSDLRALAARAAAGFQRLGLGPGSRIGLFLPNTPHYPIAYYGALSMGATVVNFSPLYSAEEVIAQARDSGTEILVCLDLARLFEPMRRALEAGAVKRLIVGNLAEVLPPAKAIGYRLLKRAERVRVRADERHVTFEQLLRNRGRFTPAKIDPEADIALIQYTGGTTGTPMLPGFFLMLSLAWAYTRFPMKRHGPGRDVPRRAGRRSGRHRPGSPSDRRADPSRSLALDGGDRDGGSVILRRQLLDRSSSSGSSLRARVHEAVCTGGRRAPDCQLGGDVDARRWARRLWSRRGCARGRTKCRRAPV